MKIIGVTGSFGAGKSTVAGFFGELGAVVLDADRLAHETLDRGGKVYGTVVGSFGPAVLDGRGRIDRKRLGGMVFRDKRLLARLCAIIHPAVIKEIKGRIQALRRRRPSAAVVVDAPLLIEAGLVPLVDTVIVVKTDPKVQIARCRKKTGMSVAPITARIRAQMPLREKIRYADFVINNNRTRQEVRREVRRIWEKMRW